MDAGSSSGSSVGRSSRERYGSALTVSAKIE